MIKRLVLAAALVLSTSLAAHADEMAFTSWGGTTQDAQKEAWADPFTKATGITVLQDGPTDYGKLKAMVESGNVTWDVVDVEYDFALAAAKAGLLEPIDFAVVDKAQIDPRFVTDNAVGSFYYSFVLGYNKDVLKEDPRWFESAFTSLIIGLLTMIASVLLGLMASFALVRGKFPGRQLLRGLFLTPMVLPVIVFAVALYALFLRIGLSGTLFGFVLAHTILAFPFAVITISNSLSAFDTAVENAAVLCGATPLEAKLRITLPAIGRGGQLATGGARIPDRPGWYFSPTVIELASNADELAQTELFGPVLAVIPFDDEEEALSLANSTRFGLAAGLFTRDVGRVHRITGRLRAGIQFVNCYRMGAPMGPIGGFGDSGKGREGGIDAVRDFTKPVTVWIDTRV